MQFRQLIPFTLLFAACGHNSVAYYIPDNGDVPLINKQGKTIKDRFLLPIGYSRIPVTGFGDYLRTLVLKPHGADVLHYDGSKKYKNVHAAVISMDTGNKDLQQCADAVMRLRAEYLYHTQQYDKIHFKFTSGFVAAYSKWKDGYRISVKGNNVSWVKSARPSTDYKSFRSFMEVVFSYAGTMSLSKELKPVAVKDIQPGDVFIKGGSPGHAVMVVDVAQNAKGEKLFMIAQSYMPAQEIEILENVDDENLSPWYKVDATNTTVATPEWDFTIYDLKRFE